MSKRTKEDDEVCFDDARAIAETRNGLSLLMECSDFDEPKWVPKKCIHDNSEVYRKGDSGTLILQRWWAEKEKLV